MSKVWTKILPPGGKWSGVVGHGKQIRFTALGEGANVSVLLFNAKDLNESYNMSDTMKAQFISRLTRGDVLLGDNGRALASIVEDSLGWHDPIGGYIRRSKTDMKYGVTNFQEQRNERFRSGDENLSIELIRNGLSQRDLGPVVNLFSKIVCDEEGYLHFQEGHCPEGSTVTLRTELDVLLVLSNTPNPHDPRTEYPSVPVQIEVFEAPPVNEFDYCVNLRPENKRAFENSWEFLALS
ncbi:urea amidolyase associated protein UAAP1 [Paenibacillus xylaniclasticus]|uniref:urea amidolyase associated protein UAAP1 n=1 Tax=Paenibacillus xylaniclasticus TaxID=588083 RepID=UPI000FDC1EAE|nr:MULTISPECIES: urea amidolyase associated protein UAAP1 [Paenibacillus]GFN33999.1 urea carboxylase [Paenibacillus curdlanolyticus]